MDMQEAGRMMISSSVLSIWNMIEPRILLCNRAKHEKLRSLFIIFLSLSFGSTVGIAIRSFVRSMFSSHANVGCVREPFDFIYIAMWNHASALSIPCDDGKLRSFKNVSTKLWPCPSNLWILCDFRLGQ